MKLNSLISVLLVTLLTKVFAETQEKCFGEHSVLLSRISGVVVDDCKLQRRVARNTNSVTRKYVINSSSRNDNMNTRNQRNGYPTYVKPPSTEKTFAGSRHIIGNGGLIAMSCDKGYIWYSSASQCLPNYEQSDYVDSDVMWYPK